MRRAYGFLRDRLRRVAAIGRPRAVILLYHRIAAPRTDPLLLCVSPKHFREHVSIIRERYQPVSLSGLGHMLENGLSHRSVAITFDDGYADNLLRAGPVLEAAGVRATVFASPGLANREAYHDVLEHCLLRARTLPRILRLRMAGEDAEWDLGDWASLPERVDESYWAWNCSMKTIPTPRQGVYLDIFSRLRDLGRDDREVALRQLMETAASETIPCKEHRYLEAQELRSMHAGGVFEVGAHTVNHLRLCKLPVEEQFAEMVQSKRILESQIGGEVTAFAYPYGSAWDVSAKSVVLAKQAGFRMACANEPGCVLRGTDPFWLPRFLVRDWSGDEFARKLESFFDPLSVREPTGCT